MTTKEEILATLNDEDMNDLFQYSSDVDGWKVIENEMVDYDEGNVTYNTIAQHIESGRFFSGSYVTNSWADSYDNFDASDIIEVEPKEVTKIEYVAVSNS